MRSLKLSIFVISIFFLFQSAIIFAKEISLNVGVYENPPKIFIDSHGVPAGYHIDILNEIARLEGWKLTYFIGSWDELLDKLLTGELDIVPDVAYNEERADLFHFNNETVLLNWAVVYSASSFDNALITDLNNRSIAVMANSIHTEGSRGIIKLTESYGLKCKFVYKENYDDCFTALDKREVDFAVVNRLFGLEKEGESKFKRTSIVFNPSSLRFALSKHFELKTEVASRIDIRIVEFNSSVIDNPIQRAFDRHIKKNIRKEISFYRIINILLFSLVIVLFFGSFFIYIFFISGKSRSYGKVLGGLNSVSEVREGIIDSSITSMGLFSVLLSGSFLYHAFSNNWDYSYIVFFVINLILIITTLFRTRIKFFVKYWVLMISLFGIGYMILQSWGRVGVSFLFLMSAALITSLVFGKKRGVVVLILGFFLTMAFGVAINYKLVRIINDSSGFLFAPSTWILTIVIVFVLFFTILSGIEKLNLILMGFVENLESMVNLRTADLNKEIEERKEIEVLLYNAKLTAEEASRAKSTFLAGITHEIRTPLNAIIGYSQLMIRDVDISDVVKKQIGTILFSGEHLLEIINEILEMSKIEAGITAVSYDTADLSKVLESIKRMFELKAAKKNIKLIIVLDERVPAIIRTDINKVRQVVINLIGNALKFTETGYIKLNIKAGEYSGENNRGIITIEVEDTGSGIDDEEALRIFRPFEQTISGKMAGGTGLGLSISKKYANLLNGDIHLKSKIGEGSTFIFSFEYQRGLEEDVFNEDEGRYIIGIKSGFGKKVLVVDDRAVNRDILNKILIPLGFIVVEAVDGYDALAKVESFIPDVILLDIVMPELDGLEVIKRVKEMADGDRYKIIVITASALEEDKGRVMKLGADSFIRKPFNQTLVLEEIGRLTGVEYQYEDTRAAEQAYRKVDDNEYRDFFKNADRIAIDQIYLALQIGDTKKILDMMSSFDKDEPVINHFIESIDEYDYNGILSIIDRWKTLLL